MVKSWVLVVLKKYFNCPGIFCRIIILIAVDAGGIAVLEDDTDHQRVIVNGHGMAKAVYSVGIGGFEIGLLPPCGVRYV